MTDLGDILSTVVQQVFVINLDQCPERLKRISLQLQGLDFARIKALLPEEDPRVVRYVANYDKTHPEPASFQQRKLMANGLSHRDIWEIQVREGLECVLVLEDDVFFRKDWVEQTVKRIKELNRVDPEWRMFMLNAEGFITWDQHGLRAIPTNNPMLCAGAYVLNLRGAKVLYHRYQDDSFDPFVASDYRLKWLQEQSQQCYFEFPLLAIQENFDSVIGGKSQDHVLGIKKWHLENYKPHFGQLYDWPTAP